MLRMFDCLSVLCVLWIPLFVLDLFARQQLTSVLLLRVVMRGVTDVVCRFVTGGMCLQPIC